MMSARSTPEAVRTQNLALLLGMLHRDGALSRAALTERSGLNRSTIADLVGLLDEAGIVTQRAPDPSRRVGRPSPVVSVSDSVAVIAAHPEVDALEVAAVGLDRRVIVRTRVEYDTAPTAGDAVEHIAEVVARWRESALAAHRLVGAGVAVPGLVRRGDGLVRDAPHLRWRDEPLRDMVADALSLPTAVGNDASLGAMAEHLFGAARGIDDVVYLNGGASGIGGGLVIDGRLVSGAGGFAGEFGQNRPGIASDDDRRATDGVLEDEVSRSRLLSAAGLTVADDAVLRETLSTSSNPQVEAEVARQQRILSTALANAVNVLNPSAIVLGGFLAVISELDPNALAGAVVAQAMGPSAEHVTIRPALLADDRLLIGAAHAAFAPLLRDPLG